MAPIDGSKAENRVTAAATSSNFSAQVRLPDNASIFTAELQALKMAFNIQIGIILLYLLTPYLVFKLVIATTVMILLCKIF